MNRETRLALLVALLPGIIFAGSLYIRLENKPQLATFKVFNTVSAKDNSATRTMIMTYGEGVYLFLGNYTDTFLLDETYNITYIYSSASNRNNRDLVILEIKHID